MRFMVVDREGKEVPDCIIVKTRYNGFDIYETKEDYLAGLDIIQKHQRYCSIILKFD